MWKFNFALFEHILEFKIFFGWGALLYWKDSLRYQKQSFNIHHSVRDSMRPTGLVRNNVNCVVLIKLSQTKPKPGSKWCPDMLFLVPTISEWLLYSQEDHRYRWGPGSRRSSREGGSVRSWPSLGQVRLDCWTTSSAGWPGPRPAPSLSSSKPWRPLPQQGEDGAVGSETRCPGLQGC